MKESMLVIIIKGAISGAIKGAVTGAITGAITAIVHEGLFNNN